MARLQNNCPMSGDRIGWHNFYAKQFDHWVRVEDHRNAREAAHLALWYLFLHLAEGSSK